MKMKWLTSTDYVMREEVVKLLEEYFPKYKFSFAYLSIFDKDYLKFRSIDSNKHYVVDLMETLEDVPFNAETVALALKPLVVSTLTDDVMKDLLHGNNLPTNNSSGSKE
jgi:hypothetical protein